MIAAFVALLALAVQDPPPPPVSPDVDAPPPVRPFEPPSDFGREIPQGDGAARPHRGPIPAPVPVEAYTGQYEAEPTAAEAGYAQGVAGAELTMDARAGPLDGRWSVVDASGRPLLRLVLSDPGPDLAVEGAWRAESGPGRGVAASDGEGGRRDVDLVLHGAGVLRLTPVPAGWEGVLIDPEGRARPVRLTR
ncbi:MAG: hypothetical protein KJ954_03970 [Alphaproteobacteria bacterium]|nr:hypothetical protein [Alphaproteobacteria bacterium]